jgi:hypothetical protein
MMNQQSKPTVTIEDLLRLKRAERPPAEFWTEFDRELRDKQLAALVEKRPWWRTFPQTLRGLSRYHLPLGATAVLAVTLLSIRDYQPAASHSAINNLPDYDVPIQEVAAPVTTIAASPIATEASEAPVTATVEVAAPEPMLASEANPPGELARMIPMLTGNEASRAEMRPSARSVAENRAVAEALLGTSSGFETRALPVRVTPQEPLAQMSIPSETRRSRFATVFAAAAVGTSPVPTARVARRLSDEQLYDTIHRFGASGNSVSFRF